MPYDGVFPTIHFQGNPKIKYKRENKNWELTCHQIDSTIREKIQLSIFSSTDVKVCGSSQFPKLPYKDFAFSFMRGEETFHFNGDDAFLSNSIPPLLSIPDSAGRGSSQSPMALLIIVLKTIELDNQNVNL